MWVALDLFFEILGKRSKRHDLRALLVDRVFGQFQIHFKDDAEHSIATDGQAKQFCVFRPAGVDHGTISKHDAEAKDTLNDCRKLKVPAVRICRKRSVHSEIVVGLHGFHGQAGRIHGVLNFLPGNAALDGYPLARYVEREDAIKALQIDSDCAVRKRMATKIVRGAHQADWQIPSASFLQSFPDRRDSARGIDCFQARGVDAPRIHYMEVRGFFLDFMERAL